jgi:hypothetical protein
MNLSKFTFKINFVPLFYLLSKKNRYKFSQKINDLKIQYYGRRRFFKQKKGIGDS